MLVALTGASGFIGSYTAKTLHAAGYEVRAMVREKSRREHIAPYVAQWCEGDQADPQAIAGLVAGVDAVIHNSVDWEALHRSPAFHFERNIMGTLRLLESARQAGVRQFVFVSSVAVYHEILKDRPLDENHPTWPNSLYGAYKASIEPQLLSYHAYDGMNTSAWRPAAVYGIDPNPVRSQWYELVRTAKAGGNIDLAQGGKITHVQDVADALTYAIGDESVAGQFYNLVDCYMYWQQAAEFARELTGSSANITNRKGSGPRNQFDTRKAVEFFNRHGNSQAIRRGEQGVREYVAELLKTLVPAR